MPSLTRILLVLLLIGLFFFAGMECQRCSDALAFKPDLSQEIVWDSKSERSYYLIKKSWGLTGNHSMCAISHKSFHETKDEDGYWWPDTLHDYIWHEHSEFLYQLRRDTLHVWAYTLPNNQSKLRPDPSIKIHVVENPVYLTLREQVDSTLKLLH